ncbi:MAG: T9SS type A sorting domain-containing protein [Candidatus Eisenbacteria bacterium]
MMRRLLLLSLAGAFSLTPIPSHGVALFGLVNTGEIFTSGDGGVTWTVLSALPVRDAVALLALDQPAELYLSTVSGSAFRSIDGGSTWSPVGVVNASDVTGMTSTPAGGLLLLTRAGTVWLSRDQGASFAAHGTMVASNLVSIAFDPYSLKHYALTSTGEVAMSDDDGEVWLSVGSLPVSDAMAIQPHNYALYVLTSRGTIYESTDEAASWTPISSLSQVHMTSLISDGTNLYAVTSEGEVASSPDGVNWSWEGAINQVSVMALGTDRPAGTGLPGGISSGLSLSLDTPSPNPRTGTTPTVFSFNLPQGETVRFDLYDIRGRLVVRRSTERFSTTGRQSIEWNPGELPTGVYFVRLSTGSGAATSTKWSVVR